MMISHFITLDPELYTGSMGTINTKVRSPTATAWALSAITVVLFGEMAFDLRDGKAVKFLIFEFSDTIALMVTIVLGLCALLFIGWLISLYADPGLLELFPIRAASIGPDDQTKVPTGSDDSSSDDNKSYQLRRQRRLRFRQQRYSGALGEWEVSIQCYSTAEEKLGVFKRIELSGPGLKEVLLYGDIRSDGNLLESLAEYRELFGRFDIRYIRPE